MTERPSLYRFLVTDIVGGANILENLEGGAERALLLPLSPKTPSESHEIDFAMLEAGDILIMEYDEHGKLVDVRAKVPDDTASIIKLREFEIIDIRHTEGNIGGPYDGGGRHIMIKGKADDGTEYVMPVMTEHFWIPAWDLGNLEKALMNVQIAQYEGETPETRLSHEVTTRQFYAFHNELASFKAALNEVFYPKEKEGKERVATLFDMATSFTTHSLKMSQTDPGARAYMVIAAVIENEKSKLPRLTQHPHAKRGIAIMQPYFEIDGKRVFIRTHSGPSEPDAPTTGSTQAPAPEPA